MKIRSSLAAAVLLALAVSLAACKGEPTQGTGRGTVAGVDAARQEITLDHGPIPGMMSAMTMTFAVSDAKLLEGVAPGAKVEFDLERRGETYVVTGLRAR